MADKFLKTNLAFLAVIIAVFILPSPTHALTGYNYHRDITINASEVSGSTDLTDFPFLFRETNPDFAHTSFGGKVENTNGYDIVFTAENGTTLRAFELEYYNPNTGEVVAWVNIPTLSATSDTTIQVWYGNSAITSSQENPNQVWNTDYKMVHHLNETSGTHYDSSQYGNDADKIGNTEQDEDGSIDGADKFDVGGNVNDNALKVDDDNSLDITEHLTLSAWAYPRDLDDDIDQRIVQKRTDKEGAMYGLNIDSNGSIEFRTDEYFWNGTSGMVDEDEWNYVSGTYDDSTNTVRLYVNGEPAGVRTNIYQNLSGNNKQIDIGGIQGRNLRTFRGSIDEVRIINAVRSEDWLKTEYNNQRPDQTFYTLSSEGGGGSAPSLNQIMRHGKFFQNGLKFLPFPGF